MAISIDAVTTANTNPDATTLSWSHTCSGSDGLLVVCIATVATTLGGTTSLTYNGVAMTRQTVISAGTVPAIRSEIYSLIAPSTGANTLLYSSNLAVSIMGTGISLNGARQINPIETTGSGSATGTSISASITPVRDFTLIIDCLTWKTAGDTITANAGQSQQSNFAGTTGKSAASTKAMPIAAATTTGYTSNNSSDGLLTSVAFRPDYPTVTGITSAAGINQITF